MLWPPFKITFLERESEKPNKRQEEEKVKIMHSEKQSDARLEQVASQYVNDFNQGCINKEEKIQRILKEHQMRCSHSLLKDDLMKPNCHYLEPENRMALEWAYRHLCKDELLQERCRRVLVANLLHILARKESLLVDEPAKKLFRVTYNVKRSGNQDMVVEAETEADARNIVQGILNKTDTASFDNVKTEFVAAEICGANEEKEEAK